MLLFRKVVISKYTFPLDGVYNYNAQLWLSLNNHDFYYCGIGKFCKNKEEALEYKRKEETK